MNISILTNVLARLGHRQSIGRKMDSVPANQAVLNRARCAIRSGQVLLAKAYVEECGDGVVYSPACLNVLGLIAEANDDWAEARRFWTQALRIDPSYAPAYTNLRRWMELFNWGRTSIPVTFGDEPEALMALRCRTQS